MTGIPAGRVGRAHGRDGSFYVDEPAHDFAEGTPVTLGGADRAVERRAGTAERPLIRLAGIGDRDAAAALRGELLLVEGEPEPLEDDEWRVSDLVGCRIEGLGEVVRVLDGPSCDLLEVGADAVLVPFVRDAVRGIDRQARVIEIDRGFLGL